MYRKVYRFLELIFFLLLANLYEELRKKNGNLKLN